MSKKLLNKTTRSFLSYAIIVLLASAPAFYYICQWLYVYETDEVLLFHKGAFVNHSHNNFTQTDIAAWNKYNRDVEIVPDLGVTKDSIAGQLLYDSVSKGNEPFRILYAPVNIEGKKYTYIEKSNLVEMEGMVISIAIMFLCIILLLLTGVIYISRASATKIWQPFYDTLRKIQDFEIDKNRQPQFAATDIEEFDSLNKSIEKLIEKNTAIYKSQREFVENAAHELQTPLALFQTKVETLAQNHELSEEQSALLGSLNSDIARMNRLNKNLLLLSKIDNDTFDKQPVLLNDIIDKHLDFFKEQGEPKNISFEIDNVNPLKVNTNPALAEILVNNLFMNAIRHNIKGGKISVVTHQSTLIFANSGPEVPLNPEKLFNRFSKADPSAQGNGLGLAIIKKIAEQNNWLIDYSYTNNLHQFTVTFP
jgi:signal transduction histidine kinase